MPETKAVVGILMGSKSDYQTMQECLKILDEFSVPYEVKILSAHRNPEAVVEYAKTANKKGIKVIIAAAGKSAHLPGIIASWCVLPVIGVPMKTDDLGGLDSLLSIVQMPAGVSVGCMGIGSAGAKNSAIYAIQILALSDQKLEEKFLKYKKELADANK